MIGLVVFPFVKPLVPARCVSAFFESICGPTQHYLLGHMRLYKILNTPKYTVKSPSVIVLSTSVNLTVSSNSTTISSTFLEARVEARDP